MRFCCISDTHGTPILASNFEPHDVTLFAGDWTASRNPSLQFQQTAAFLAQISQLPSAHQIIIAGNHDGLPSDQPELFQSLLADYPSVTYLQDSLTTIDNFVIYGSPYSLPFYDWWFMASEHRLKQIYSNIPDNTDILITHGAAYDILDETTRGINTGSTSLRIRINELPNLKLHVCGHIHEAAGTFTTDKYIAVNACQLDNYYVDNFYPTYITL